MNGSHRLIVGIGSVAFSVAIACAAYAVGVSYAVGGLYPAVPFGLLVPMSVLMGVVAAPIGINEGIAARVLMPLAAVMAMALVAQLAGGYPLLAFAGALPWLLLLAPLGGVLTRLARTEAIRGGVAVALLVGAIVAVNFEERLALPALSRSVTITTEVAAPQRDVWEHVINVDSINPADSPNRSLGRGSLPRVHSVGLFAPDVGGVRRVRLVGGVELDQHVSDWMEGERIEFRGAPDSTLSFGANRSLDGLHELEPLTDSTTRLVSRLDYRAPRYITSLGAKWTDFLFRAFLEDFVRVVAARAELAAREHMPYLTAEMRQFEARLLASFAVDSPRTGLSVFDEAMIRLPDGRYESIGGVSIPGFATSESVDNSLRNVLTWSATRARLTGWATTYSSGRSELRYEFEDRLGRCVNIRRSLRLNEQRRIDLGPRELSTCNIVAFAEVIRRGRRLARAPLDINSMDVLFTTVGKYPGTVDVYIDSIVVTVRGAAVRMKLLEGKQQTLDSITASLGRASPRGSWNPGASSKPVVLGWKGVEGETTDVRRMRFTIPRDSGESLGDRWLVIAHHLTVPKTAENPYGLAWTYAHGPKEMFRAIPD